MTGAVLAMAMLAASQNAYRVDWVGDSALTGGLALLLVLQDGVVARSLEGGLSCQQRTPEGRCDPNVLSALDQYSVNRTSDAWAVAADVGMGVMLAAPLLAVGLDSALGSTDTPWGDFGGDALVMAEAVLAARAITGVLKFAVRRPRPTQYSADRYTGSFEHQLSFPSGHATTAAAAAAAFATTIFLRHPSSPWAWVSLGVGTTITGVVGYARIGQGMHFPTDVMAGVVIGGVVGFLVPWLHRRESGGVTIMASGRAPLLSYSGAW